MRASAMLAAPEETGGDRREALQRCSAVLTREGFLVSWVGAIAPGRGAKAPDLLAAMGPRVVRIVVLLEPDVDEPETKVRIRAALKEGETRVCVPWPLRWRVISNLERWGLSGVSVAGV